MLCGPGVRLHLLGRTDPGLDVIGEADHADSLPNSETDSWRDATVESLDASLLVDIRQGALKKYQLLRFMTMTPETYLKTVSLAGLFTLVCFAIDCISTRTTSIGWFHVPSAPPTVEAAILSRAPKLSFSPFPRALRIPCSARRAKPMRDPQLVI